MTGAGPRASSMRELPGVVDLCRPDGRLDPAAVGFTRHARVNPNLRGWGRTKRWEYWGVITPTHVIGLTISDLDYAAVHQVYLLERATGREAETGALVPLGGGVDLPDTRPPLTASVRRRGLELTFADRADGATQLAARVDRGGLRLAVDLVVDAGVRADGSPGESLGVVVPWSERRFQYTVKDLARPVHGELVVDGRTVAVGDGAWAVLDRGRGRWPYRMTWFWGAGSGLVDGTRLGLQLGGAWTDGTGVTENALIVDGVVDPIAEELRWEPGYERADGRWVVTGERVDARLEPWHTRRAATNALVIASDTVQAFGAWRGRVRGADGAWRSVDGLVGWAERARNRW